MNYVVWDIETDSAQLDWATMIEIGAILLDENFNEKERFTARCRMPQDRVPSATALCINKSNVDLIVLGISSKGIEWVSEQLKNICWQIFNSLIVYFGRISD